MKKFFLALLALTMSTAAFANGPWYRSFQDYKFPTQAILEHYSWGSPIVATAAQLVSGGTLTTSQANTLSTFAHQPDYPRNVTITPTGTTANVGACTAVVSGTNIYGKAITENFSISSTQSTATTGNKAFASLTSVLFPSACTTGSGVTVNVGVGSKLGIIRCADDAGKYVFSEFNLAYETTRGTFATNATAVESNTFAPNGTMDGTKQVDLYYVENFRCYPN